MNLAGVYTPDRPQGGADRVRDWAAAIRSELQDPLNNRRETS